MTQYCNRNMNWKLYCLVSGSQCDQFQNPASSVSSSISRAGIRKATVSYGSAATWTWSVYDAEQKSISTYNEVLVGLVRWLSFLFPSAHESSARHNSCFYLRKMNLHHHSLLPRVSVPDFRHSITRAANF